MRNEDGRVIGFGKQKGNEVETASTFPKSVKSECI